MPEYLAPGVFVEEIERGPKPIEGVATSTAAFIGETERGGLKPKFITGYGEYLRHYGDVFKDGKYMPYTVKAFFDNGGRRCYIARVVPARRETDGDNAKVAGSPQAGIGKIHFEAIGPGEWGNRIWIHVGPGTTLGGDGNPVGFRLRAYYWRATPTPAPTFDAKGNLTGTTPPPTAAEDFDDLSLDEDHPNYWGKRVNHGNSDLIEITGADADAVIPNAAVQAPLIGGTNGTENLIRADFDGDKNSNKPSGLLALELDNYRDVAVLHAPSLADEELNKAVTEAVIGHCERNKYRFAVIDSRPNVANSSTLSPRNDNDTKYAAFYYPWIEISDPKSGARKKVPPGGAVCGIYSRSDNARGVWKAPANETVAGALDLEFDIDHGKQENLNPKGVNCIRRFPGRGIRVWGARTLSSDPLWKYVNVRRLFIFIEASIYQSTQWVVFEPNDQTLWSRLKQTVTLFLRTQWREGALFGASEEEAFVVNVGRDTMTEDDILNGRLIIEVGIAPVRPAEFVIFRVYQKTQEASS